MESLLNEMKGLSLNMKPKTGLVYHKDTLLHSYDPDDNISESHVENPLRVKSIFQRLESKNLIEKCDFLNEFEEIDDRIIKQVHGEAYFDYITSLWPEGCTKTKKVYTDTYYNQHTKRAAFLAAEGARLAVENVYEGKWNNAYAMIRPPGHHAAAKNNRIQGFCMINNVVVAAKSLVAKKGKIRIAILDWDVHHGDSTQKMCYDDPEILYISIHKYNDGKFYPGPSGSVNNVGEGAGVGYNLNFPLNPIKNQFIGDSEYVYAFERAILPILKEYKPEIVIISAGFDCLINDPIGKLFVTQNGLSYITLQLKQQITGKIVVVLEGGYNYKEISIASECILRVMLGEFYPNEACRTAISLYQMIKYLNISPLFLEQTEENLRVWKKYWKCLEDETFQKKIEKTASNIFYIPNKHKYRATPETITRLNCKIEEIDGYTQLLNRLGEDTHKYVAKVIEREIKEECANITYQNLNPDGKFNFINIAIADSSTNGFTASSLFEKYKFYVQSYQIVNKHRQILESRKGPFLRLPIDETIDYFTRIFNVLRKRENALSAIEQIIVFIESAMTYMVQNKFSLVQPKLLVYYDSKTGSVICKFVNFIDVEDHFTKNAEHSLGGVREFFIAFKNFVLTK